MPASKLSRVPRPKVQQLRLRDRLNLAGHPRVDFQTGRTGTLSRELRLEFGAPFRLRIPLMANASRLKEVHRACQSALGFPRLRNLLICSGMASRNSFLGILLPSCHCRICGSVPVLWHTKRRAKVQCGSVTRSGVRFGVANPLLETGSRFMPDESPQKAPRACSPCASLRGSDLKVPDRSPARRSLPRETCPPSCESCLFSALRRARVTRRRLLGHRATQRRD
jgi:hypothetical protein